MKKLKQTLVTIAIGITVLLASSCDATKTDCAYEVQQIDVHYDALIDDAREEGDQELIRLLIIARNKAVDEIGC